MGAHTHPLAKMDSTKEAYGVTPLPFDLRGACVDGKILTSRMWNTWSVYLLLGQISASVWFLYFGVSVHRGQAPAAEPGAGLSRLPRRQPEHHFLVAGAPDADLATPALPAAQDSHSLLVPNSS